MVTGGREAWLQEGERHGYRRERGMVTEGERHGYRRERGMVTGGREAWLQEGEMHSYRRERVSSIKHRAMRVLT